MSEQQRFWRAYADAQARLNLRCSHLGDNYQIGLTRPRPVSSIFKKEDKKQVENYRPVSLTYIVCKVMESVVRDRLMYHMESNNLFLKDQFGFRSDYSYVTQLLHVLEEWSKALDSLQNIDVIYLDFRKAFDTVAHVV